MTPQLPSDQQIDKAVQKAFTDNMPEDRASDFARKWINKFWGSARKAYDRWDKEYMCSDLEAMYCGKHWKNAPDGYRPYVANLMFGTVQTQIPSSGFRAIKAHLKPKPWKQDYDQETASAQARLRSDAVNSFLGDSKNYVLDTLQLAQLNAYSRFGVIEVGYSASWILNPKHTPGSTDRDNFSQPFFTNQDTPEVIAEPPFEPEEESIYWKYIPACNFRVSAANSWILDRCAWAGYYEDVSIDDLLANPTIAPLLEDVNYAASGASAEYSDGESSVGKSYESTGDNNSRPVLGGDLVRLIHIFDYKSNTRHLFLDLHNIYLTSIKFKRNPLKVLKYHPVIGKDTFYPIPVMYNWVSPQDDYNEARESQRAFRRKFLRKYITKDGAFEDEELDKLTDGVDGAIAKTSSANLADAIAPLPLPTMGAETVQVLIASKSDFNEVSGTPAEARGTADRQTATQATIIDQRSGVRETAIAERTAAWICDIIAETAKLQAEKLTLPVWIKYALDSDSITAQQETSNIAETWKQIEPLAEFDEDFDFDVNVTISALSPIENEKEKNALLEFLAVLNTYPQISLSPKLVREVADRIGYRNESVIQEFMYMAQLAMLGTMEQASAVVGGMAERTTQQATPPDQQQITNQIANQVGLPQ